jgi:MerR family redox-sensitive transcriptional activator SoxR
MGELTIGEVARRAGLRTSALRYYEDLGILRPAERVSGRRRYDESSVGVVGAVLFFRDAGFTLSEIGELMVARARSAREWRELARRKLAELDEQIAKARAAREAIDHALRCPHEDILHCTNFHSLVTARLAGQPLHEAHSH